MSRCPLHTNVWRAAQLLARPQGATAHEVADVLGCRTDKAHALIAGGVKSGQVRFVRFDVARRCGAVGPAPGVYVLVAVP